MTAARDRMVVRTRDGYKSMPRRAALGLISAGRATIDRDHERVQQEIAGQIATSVGVPGPAMNIDTGETTAPGEPLPEIPEPDEDLHEWFEDQAKNLRSDEPTPDPALSEPRGNASRLVWADYAESLGLTLTDDMTRNEIRDAAREAATSTARLPQPARDAGGRLDTPEDEPVTESAVTDGENPGQE